MTELLLLCIIIPKYMYAKGGAFMSYLYKYKELEEREEFENLLEDYVLDLLYKSGYMEH